MQKRSSLASAALHSRHVGSGVSPDLKAFLLVQMVLLRILKDVSFILEGSMFSDPTL
jgi:hypothetical protein